jgi:exodeoxyribonuclease-3
MKIFSWNVNGIRSVISKGDLQSFIDSYQPDILCLQETKAQRYQAEIDLAQYEEFWNSAQRKGYSGTAIFTKIKPLSVQLDFPEADLVDQYGDLNQEGRVLCAEFDNFYLVAVYTPNSKPDLSRLAIRQRWDKTFLDMVQRLQQTKPVIFCGDLNVAYQEIDLANPKANIGKHGFTDQERAGFGHYLEAGFVDTFREIHGAIPNQYSWWSHWARARERNIGWRIDYFLASADLVKSIRQADIHPDVFGSDHCPISLTLEDNL